jgi:hypothetical protein
MLSLDVTRDKAQHDLPFDDILGGRGAVGGNQSVAWPNIANLWFPTGLINSVYGFPGLLKVLNIEADLSRLKWLEVDSVWLASRAKSGIWLNSARLKSATNSTSSLPESRVTATLSKADSQFEVLTYHSPNSGSRPQEVMISRLHGNIWGVAELQGSFNPPGRWDVRVGEWFRQQLRVWLVLQRWWSEAWTRKVLLRSCRITKVSGCDQAWWRWDSS